MIIQRRFFLLLNKNLCCDPSLVQSNDGSQNMFLWRKMANYPLNIPLTLLIWSTAEDVEIFPLI